jgi:2'-5' RNA ligase
MIDGVTTAPRNRAADLRLFVSVEPGAAAAADLREVLSGLAVSRANEPGHSTRVADPARWHLTLAFLGDVPAAHVPDATAAMATAAAAVAPFRLRLSGGGTFGRGRFTLLWVGLAGDTPALSTLADRVRAQLRRSRLPFDRKPFRPHLTLARPGDRIGAEQLAADVATLAAYESPEWTVNEVNLVSSLLGPDPVHTRVASAPISG